MKRHQLSELINEKGLEAKKVAHALFPENKYPTHALKYILDGKSSLTYDQMCILAAMTNVKVPRLFEMHSNQKSAIRIYVDGYLAELDTANWTVSVSQIAGGNEQHLLIDSDIALSDLLSRIKLLITK